MKKKKIDSGLYYLPGTPYYIRRNESGYPGAGTWDLFALSDEPETLLEHNGREVPVSWCERWDTLREAISDAQRKLGSQTEG